MATYVRAWIDHWEYGLFEDATPASGKWMEWEVSAAKHAHGLREGSGKIVGILIKATMTDYKSLACRIANVIETEVEEADCPDNFICTMVLQLEGALVPEVLSHLAENLGVATEFNLLGQLIQ